jgi:chromosome segregation ATPase
MGGKNSKVGMKSDNSEILLALNAMQQKLEDNDTKLNTKIDQLNLEIKKIKLNLSVCNKQLIEYENTIDYLKKGQLEIRNEKLIKNGHKIQIKLNKLENLKLEKQSKINELKEESQELKDETNNLNFIEKPLFEEKNLFQIDSIEKKITNLEDEILGINQEIKDFENYFKEVNGILEAEIKEILKAEDIVNKNKEERELMQKNLTSNLSANSQTTINPESKKIVSKRIRKPKEKWTTGEKIAAFLIPECTWTPNKIINLDPSNNLEIK